MAISAEKIEANFNKHLKIIDMFITSDRKEKVLAMIESLGEEYLLSPASTKAIFHNAFPGGYIDHVNRVIQYSLKQKELYETMKGIIDFTDEELIISALFHDLGKIGNGELSNYLPQTDKWRKDNLGEIYKNNPELSFMLIQDRSLFILQKFGIVLSEKEYIAIKIHDGMYEESNKPYLVSYNKDTKLKSNLSYILHTADFLASKVEQDIDQNIV